MSSRSELTAKKGVVFKTSSPFDTPRKMHPLVEWTNAAIEN